MTESTAERGNRAQLPSLTGLRFVAAFLVLVAHAAHTVMVIDPPFYLPFGSAIAFIGMTIFFVLSGFVIHYNYGRLFRAQPLGTAVSTFAVARVSRLYPLFFFCFLVALSTTPLASVFPIRTYLFAFLTTMTQSWIFVEVSPNAILCTSFYPHAWSISTEIFFYLLYTLVVAFVGRAGGPVRATVAAVLWTATSYGFLYWVHSTNGGGLKWLVLWPSPGDLADGIWAGYIGYLNPLIRLPEFVLGCLTAQVYLGVEGKLVGRRERVIGRAITYLALALMVAGPAWYYLSTFRVPGVLPPLPAFVGFLNFNFLLAPAVAVFLFAAVRYPTLVTRPLNWRPVVVLGEASYSIYLLHPWVLHVFLAPGPQKFSDLVACEWAVRMTMSVGFCLCISLGTYAAIEVPGRRWLRGALGWAAGVRAPAAGWRRPVFAVAVYAVPCAGIAAGMYLFRTTTAPAQLLATGNQLAGAGRTDDAVRCYDRALELNPRMSAALFQRAMLRVNGQDCSASTISLH